MPCYREESTVGPRLGPTVFCVLAQRGTVSRIAASGQREGNIFSVLVAFAFFIPMTNPGTGALGNELPEACRRLLEAQSTFLSTPNPSASSLGKAASDSSTHGGLRLTHNIFDCIRKCCGPSPARGGIEIQRG